MNTSDPDFPEVGDSAVDSRISDSDHKPEPCCGEVMLQRAKRRIKSATLPEIAGVAATGFALGWLIVSKSRSCRAQQSFLNSVTPAVTKGVQDAWSQLRSSEIAQRVGQQAGKLKAHW